jgi:uncharacterized protein (DUF362 family)
MHYTIGDPERLSRDIAILNQMFAPLVSILDASDCLINGGPEGVGDDAVRTSPALVLASRDRIALDAGGATLIKLGLESTHVALPDEVYPLATTTAPWAYPQIRHGSEIGLGVASSDLVDIAFDGVEAAAQFESLYRAT